MTKKSKYYDWEKTLSHNADVTVVIGSRGAGKAFDLRSKLRHVNDVTKATENHTDTLRMWHHDQEE